MLLLELGIAKGHTVDCWAGMYKLTEGPVPCNSECQSLRVSAAAFQGVEHFPLKERHMEKPPPLSCCKCAGRASHSDAHRILFKYVFQKASCCGLGWRIRKALHCPGPFKEHLVPTTSLQVRKQDPKREGPNVAQQAGDRVKLVAESGGKPRLLCF